MAQVNVKYRWLLALGAVLQGALAVSNLVLEAGGGVLNWGTALLLAIFAGYLTLMASACLLAAGLWWVSQGRNWWLVVNGITLGVVGMISNELVHVGRLHFWVVALLFAAMAVSLASLALNCCLRWGAWGAGSFALAFLTMSVGWLPFDFAPSLHGLADHFWWRGGLWIGVYFAFSAVCLMMIALRVKPDTVTPDTVCLPNRA